MEATTVMKKIFLSILASTLIANVLMAQSPLVHTSNGCMVPRAPSVRPLVEAENTILQKFIAKNICFSKKCLSLHSNIFNKKI